MLSDKIYFDEKVFIIIKNYLQGVFEILYKIGKG
jgi:hypothetical protein